MIHEELSSHIDADFLGIVTSSKNHTKIDDLLSSLTYSYKRCFTVTEGNCKYLQEIAPPFRDPDEVTGH
jgi:hypothetical protein